jgi:hypothetical protein
LQLNSTGLFFFSEEKLGGGRLFIILRSKGNFFSRLLLCACACIDRLVVGKESFYFPNFNSLQFYFYFYVHVRMPHSAKNVRLYLKETEIYKFDYFNSVYIILLSIFSFTMHKMRLHAAFYIFYTHICVFFMAHVFFFSNFHFTTFIVDFFLANASLHTLCMA